MEIPEIKCLLAKTKPEVGRILKENCTHSEHEQLKLVLEHFLSPSNPIDDENVLDWLGWIVAGGSTPDEFSSTVRLYDKSTTCGLVWSESTVAYRCRTCGISPCMSLCTECFHHGNHEGHDFIVFRSETGGACDCGEINIIKESGCCSFHGPNGSHALQQRGVGRLLLSPNSRSLRSDSNSTSSSNDQSAPADLLCIASGMMGHLFHRLILSMREEHRKRMECPAKIKPIIITCKHNVENNNEIASSILIQGHKFIKMLQGFADMGVAMRQVMIQTLTKSDAYTSLVHPLPRGGGPNFKSFLEELVYWTVDFEFPEDLICLLLSMRSDLHYKEDFTRAFVLHYNLISETILRSGDPLTLCKHVAAVSVQLFSIETLAIQMVETMNLLPLLVNTLHNMINQAVVVNPKSSKIKEVIVDCDSDIMKNNYYWPIKSDLKELLSHQPVAVKFFQDEELLGGWFKFLSHFQGMNLATYIQKGNPHIEQETETHIGAFTAELEISATPMWTLLSHLKGSSTSHFTIRIVHHCFQNLLAWSEMGGGVSRGKVSFHLPLHRNLSSFIRQGLLVQGLSLEELIPPHSQLQLHSIGQQLIQLHSTFYQILGRLWSRNGTEILNQAESYVNSLCCNSMIDADLFLLQIVGGCIPRQDFLSLVFEEFQIYNSLGLLPSNSLDPEEQNTMVESCLLFLATLTSSRINLGMSDENLMALEMSTLLCKGDKLHSELMELLPERCGSDSQLKNFENSLKRVADFQSPRQMHQGKYVPKPSIWENLYDPIHTIMRSSNRAEFQVSLDRYQEFVKRSNLLGQSSSTINLWPPFRIPQLDDQQLPLPDPQLLLSSNLMLEILFVVFFRAVHLGNVPNFTISLAVYLLELAISSSSSINWFSSEEHHTTSPTTSHHSQLSIYPTADFVSNLVKKVNLSSWLDQTYINKSVPEESIISLLLQLHIQFKDNSSSYTVPDTTTYTGESRVGDGAYFIANLLHKLGCKFPIVYSFLVSETAVQDNTGEQSMEREREERRKRAKERKLQLMTELAMKRQQFMQLNEDATSSLEDNPVHRFGESGSTSPPIECEFECVICMEKGGSKFENPYGLITYLMPSSVLSHRKSVGPHGPVGMSPKPFGAYWKNEVLGFGKHFDESSIRLSLPLHYGNGVSIQTCGHYLHTDCFNSYEHSLKKSKSHHLNQREIVVLSHKKFSCPLCRGLGNSFLPIIKDSLGQMSLSSDSEDTNEENELTRAIKKRSTLVLSPKQKLGVEKFLDDIQKIVSFTKMREVNFGLNNSSSSSSIGASTTFAAQSLSLVFLNALEMESLKCKSSNPDLHRSYILPLYSVLRYSYKSLPTGHSKKISQIWEAIIGGISGSSSAKTPQPEVPLLLRDLNVLLSHLMLQLPYGTERKYLKLITQKLLALKLVQILVGLCTQLGPEDLSSISNSSTFLAPAPTYGSLLPRIVEYLCHSNRSFEGQAISMSENDELSPSTISSLLRNAPDLDNFVANRLQPFVNKVMEWSSIVSRNPDPNTSSSISDELLTSMDYIQLISQPNFDKYLSSWMEELLQHKSDISSLFMTQLISWDKPNLKDIATEYDKIFQSYRKLKCDNCKTIPSEPALCLMCGTIVCLNSFCCLDKQSKVSEVIQHSTECGMGSAVFLCVPSSAILVVVGKEACVWGSVFLDSFGEEDLDLRRGKPLFLCKERFQFLQRQWATHSFHKYELKWFPHDNML